MVTAAADVNPTVTGAEMKLTTKPGEEAAKQEVIVR
jgi:hypothetical protein